VIDREEGGTSTSWSSTVNCVDLRVRPELLAGVVECLIDGISGDQASTLPTEVAERKYIDLHVQPDDGGDRSRRRSPVYEPLRAPII